jgi:hypothetical protein
MYFVPIVRIAGWRRLAAGGARRGPIHMMSLSVSGDGPWVAWWKSSNGNKLRRHYATTKEEAEIQVKKWRVSLEPGEQTGVSVIGQTELDRLSR